MYEPKICNDKLTIVKPNVTPIERINVSHIPFGSFVKISLKFLTVKLLSTCSNDFKFLGWKAKSMDVHIGTIVKNIIPTSTGMIYNQQGTFFFKNFAVFSMRFPLKDGVPFFILFSP